MNAGTLRKPCFAMDTVWRLELCQTRLLFEARAATPLRGSRRRIAMKRVADPAPRVGSRAFQHGFACTPRCLCMRRAAHRAPVEAATSCSK